jgi:hypothetical protein
MGTHPLWPIIGNGRRDKEQAEKHGTEGRHGFLHIEEQAAACGSYSERPGPSWSQAGYYIVCIANGLVMGQVDRKLENQENGSMKTTLDLPDTLMKQVKLRAVHEGKKLKDMIAHLLRSGLAMDQNSKDSSRSAVVRLDPKTGLPVIECPHPAQPECKPEDLDSILLAQEVRWHHDAGR